MTTPEPEAGPVLYVLEPVDRCVGSRIPLGCGYPAAQHPMNVSGYHHAFEPGRHEYRPATPEEIAAAGWTKHTEDDQVETCQMVHEEPYDFASCETHDTTFALGEKCKFDGRMMWEVYAEEADAQRARAVIAEEELAELRAEKADACTQLGCQAIDRTNEAEAHAHKLEEAIRRAVLLANDAIARMREANRQVEAEAGRPSKMRPFVFADELVAAMRPVAPDTEPIEHINGERRDCPACQVEADDAARREPGGEG